MDFSICDMVSQRGLVLTMKKLTYLQIMLAMDPYFLLTFREVELISYVAQSST